ncbi:MAG: FISUMP domain-containing protein [Thermoplasmata archaeon]
MKKITLLLLIIFAIAKTQSQNFQISFTGKGASTTVDSVKVENLTQCTDTIIGGSDILHLTGVVGINSPNSFVNNTLQIYPNPITGNCTIGFDATAQGYATLNLYNVLGKRIIQLQEFLTKGKHTYSLNGIRSGVYFLTIESDNYCYKSKIISNNTLLSTTVIKHIETTSLNDQQIITSNIEKQNRLKREKSLIIEMQYTTGDRLKYTGYSGGKYRTILMQVPTISQTDTFKFVYCADADSNHYAVVQIGTQIWMAENLKTTKYNTGVSIGTTTPATLDISGEATPKYQWAYGGSESNVATYGRLYTWYAVTDSRNIAPAGWRVPTDAEWTTLTTYLLGVSVAGGKLKENCSTLWGCPNTGATNESGFTALPGGYRFSNGSFSVIGYNGYWWSSTESSTDVAWFRDMSCSSSNVSRGNYSKLYGFSVRCVRDL